MDQIKKQANVVYYEDGTVDFGRSNSCYVTDDELRFPREDSRLASGALSYRDQKNQMTTAEQDYRKSLSVQRKEKKKLERKMEDTLQELITNEAEVLAGKALVQMHRILDKNEPSAAELKVILDHFLGTPKQKVEVSGDKSLTPIVIQRQMLPEQADIRVVNEEITEEDE